MDKRKASSGLSRIGMALTFVLAAGGLAQAQQRLLYTQSNAVEEGQNAIHAYLRQADGSLRPHPAGPFLTRGTGIDNPTNGKLGPNDNDTPLVVSPDKKRLFAVNGHSNTIAVLDILPDGALRHVPGSPFPSMGVGPVSLALSGDVLLVVNRNEDPLQLEALRGGMHANYASFRVAANGKLTFLSKVELTDGQKNTQVHVPMRAPKLAFGNDFQVDIDLDGYGTVSRLFGDEQQVRGGLRSFRIDAAGRLQPVSVLTLPETAEGEAPPVPSIPLGIWDHPGQPLLYVGFVTRNQLGVYRYGAMGELSFVSAVPNSGQDICWLKPNAAGTCLYAVNNLPREERGDTASTITVFDISGERAERPVELGRVELPMPGTPFVNNRLFEQPGSAAFQLDVDREGRFLYVICQRIDQTEANPDECGNILHSVRLEASGKMTVVASRSLGADGVSKRSRPQGVVCVDL